MRWNLFAFHVIHVFPKIQIFSASYDIEQILPLILKLRPESCMKYFVIDGDNARLHTVQKVYIFRKANCCQNSCTFSVPQT
jgi:hypothetical protein